MQKLQLNRPSSHAEPGREHIDSAGSRGRGPDDNSNVAPRDVNVARLACLGPSDKEALGRYWNRHVTVACSSRAPRLLPPPWSLCSSRQAAIQCCSPQTGSETSGPFRRSVSQPLGCVVKPERLTAATGLLHHPFWSTGNLRRRLGLRLSRKLSVKFSLLAVRHRPAPQLEAGWGRSRRPNWPPLLANSYHPSSTAAIGPILL